MYEYHNHIFVRFSVLTEIIRVGMCCRSLKAWQYGIVKSMSMFDWKCVTNVYRRRILGISIWSALSYFEFNDAFGNIETLYVELCKETLTHWGRDKWPPFSRRHFQMHFLEWKCINFDWDFTAFVPRVPTENIPALVQIMVLRRLGDKPLSDPMMDSLPTHICVTRPQWVNT